MEKIEWKVAVMEQLNPSRRRENDRREMCMEELSKKREENKR